MQLWTACMDELTGAGERLASLLRARGETGADVDLAVAMLGSVMNSYLNAVFAESDHPMFMPFAGFYTHIGTPNPDCMYKSARIDGTGTYELTGFRGTAPQVSIMPFGAPTSTGQQTFAPYDFDDLSLDADGRFRVVMSAQRPDGYTGGWWRLDHEMQTLMLRSVSDDWGNHRDPLVAISRLDAPPRRTAPPDGVVRADRGHRADGRGVDRLRDPARRPIGRGGRRQRADRGRLLEQRRAARPVVPGRCLRPERRHGAAAGDEAPRGLRVPVAVADRPTVLHDRMDRRTEQPQHAAGGARRRRHTPRRGREP